MKLSEAIREGAKKRPQAFNEMLDQYGATCALGAACDVVRPELLGLGSTAQIAESLLELLMGIGWSWRMYGCPACMVPLYLDDQVIHLNDDHHWTREKIADWLEGQGL